MDDFERDLGRRLERAIEDVSRALDRPVAATSRSPRSLLAGVLVAASVATAIGIGIAKIPGRQTAGLGGDDRIFVSGSGTQGVPIGEGSPTPAASASGIATGSRPSESPADEGPTPARRACPPGGAGAIPDGMSVRLELSTHELSREDVLTMTIRVRNDGVVPVFNRRDWPPYDFWVEGSDGVLWRWADGQVPPARPMETQEQFPPGEEQVRSETWNLSRCHGASGPIPPGRYSARALWASDDGGWWSDPVTFVIR